jgi:hypothetical protein
LSPVEADNWGGGIVLTPKAIPGLAVSVDYYFVKTRNDIFQFSSQAMANDLEANGSNSPFAPLFTFDDGSKLTTPVPGQISNANWGQMDVPWGNGASVETEGVDMSATYRIPTDALGTFGVWVNATVLLKFDYEDPLIGGPYPYDGQYTDASNGIGGAQGLLPDYQINTGLSWEFQDFTYSVSARYVPEVEDRGSLHQSNIAFENAVDDGLNDFTVNGKPYTISSWFSIDMQLGYEIGKTKEHKSWYDGTRITVGCNNVTDEDPAFITSSFEDNTDKSTYDIIGRFVYFEIGRKF